MLLHFIKQVKKNNMKDVYENIVIPTYVINLSERKERLKHIQEQFKGKHEFDLFTIEACKHAIGAVGLWNSILKIIKMAMNNDDDVIIICEDDHEFTKNYSKEDLLQNIIEAENQGVELLTGGIANFSHAVPITENRLWIDSFWCTQFIIIYKNLFQKILEEPFGDTDTADGKLSEITSHKMILYPFISLQKDFGYSDVTKINQEQKGFLDNGFATTERRLEKILKVKQYYVAPNSQKI
jgi:glycosyl transferase family 25